jgi:TatD DNase family protein
MTPVPFRGKRNEPSYIKYIAENIAEIYNLKVEELARITSGNVYKLFGIGKTNQVSFTYKIRDSLYINVTNRCNAECVFCDRKREAVISGYNLKMNKSEEPPASKYIEEIGDPKLYKEIVFCGYGEPTIRWDIVKEIANYVKTHGGSTRLNTNGHGSAINKRDITQELEGLIDIVSISLNTTDPQKYSEIMGLKPEYFYEMINFAKKAKSFVKKVVMTAVTLNEIDIPSVQKFAEEEIGVEFRSRQYF